MEHNHDSMDHSMHNMNDMNNPAAGMVVTDNLEPQQHDHTGNSSPHSMMMMYFHFGSKEVILFDFWRINGFAGLVGSCVGIFILAALYEGLKVVREYLMERCQVAQMARASVLSDKRNSRSPLHESPNSVDSSAHASSQVQIVNVFKPHPLSLAHLVQTMLHMVQMVISYLLMLIFMTYNLWLCISVVLGAGAGYFAFGWRKRTVVDFNEHCH